MVSVEVIVLTKKSPTLLQFLSFTDRISKSFLKFNKVFLPNYGVFMQNASHFLNGHIFWWWFI